MDGYTRYALYAAPRDGPLTRLGARWLGWDAEAGRGAPSARDEEWPTLPRPRRALTSPARNYGFHATLKAPFALAEGATVVELHAALSALAPRLGRVRVDGLRVGALGPVVALLPEGDTSAVDALSAKLVEALDGFRAPQSPEELARRRAPGLTARQEEML